MEFIDVAFSYFAPVLLLWIALTKGNLYTYGKALLATLNTCLLLYVVFSFWQYYGLYKMAVAFGMNVSVEGLWHYAGTNALYAGKLVAQLIVPFFFLNKKWSASFLLCIIMLVLFWWDVGYAILHHEGYLLPIQQYDNVPMQIARFLCLLIGIYALLWLLKRLPFQQKK